MMSKFKPALVIILIVSVMVNGLFILLLYSASFSEDSSLFYHTPPPGCMTAAAIVSFPSGRQAVFNQVDVFLRKGEKAFFQMVAISGKQQGSLIISPIYDPDIAAVAQTAFGLEITARNPGSTLLQALTNDGIKNVLLVTVTDD